MTGSTPYKSTPVFDENTLPAGLRKEHRTKAGVWGVLTILDVEHPGLVMPEQPHFVEPIGHMTMRVDFYDQAPTL